MRVKVVDGEPLVENGKPVFVPVFEERVKLGDFVDACLYFGDRQPYFAEPPSSLYEGTDYGLEVKRRRSLTAAVLGIRRHRGRFSMDENATHRFQSSPNWPTRPRSHDDKLT